MLDVCYVLCCLSFEEKDEKIDIDIDGNTPLAITYPLLRKIVLRYKKLQYPPRYEEWTSEVFGLTTLLEPAFFHSCLLFVRSAEIPICYLADAVAVRDTLCHEWDNGNERVEECGAGGTGLTQQFDDGDGDWCWIHTPLQYTQ